MRRAFAPFLLVVLVAPSFASLASSSDDPGKLDPVPAEVRDVLSTGAAMRVVIAFREGEYGRAVVLADTLRSAGGLDAKALPALGVVITTVDEDGANIIARTPGVLAVAPDRAGRLLQAPSACGGTTTAPPTRAAAWWLGNATRVNDVNQDAQGHGRLLAVFDSGVSIAGPMSSNFLGGANGWNDFTSEASPTPMDTCGHGTKVASVAVGPQLGVAPQAKWMAARITTDGNDLTYSAALSAFNWVVAMTERPDVIVNSWGFTSITDTAFTAPFLAAVRELQSSGTVVIFAAGDGTVYAPAAFPEVTAVGYSTQAGQVGPGSPSGPSCYGPNGVLTDPCATMKPDIVAPGANMVALKPGSAGAYTAVQGTSFAAPFAAGVALLVKEENPSLSGSELGLALEMGANFRFLAPTLTNGALRPNIQFGYGLLNAERAVALPGRSNRILLMGDDNDVFRDTLSSSYDVTSLSAAQSESLQRANRTLVEYGVLILSNLNPRFEYGPIIEHAKAAGTGVVAVGDPGLTEYDGVQAYVESMGGTMVPWSTTTSLSGTLTMTSDLFPDRAVGGAIQLRTYSDSSPHAVDGYLVADAGHSEILGSMQSGQAASLVSLEGADVYVLGNIGASSVNPASQVTQEAWRAFARAVREARAPFVSPDGIPIDTVSPAIADVVIVGDKDGRIAEIAADVGFTTATIPSWDLDTLNATIAEENRYRTTTDGRSRVRLLAFHDLGPDVNLSALNDAERLRASARYPISAMVLGGPEASALGVFQDLWQYSLVGTATSLAVASPDHVNQYGETGDILSIAADVSTFTLPTPSGWKASYVTPDGAAIGVAIEPNHSAPNTRALIGLSGADMPAGAESRRLIARSLLYVARVPLLDAVTISSATVGEDTHVRWDPLANAYVLNAYEFRGGTLTIRDLDANLSVENSVFVKTDVPVGISIENSSGVIQIRGNYFSNKDPSIRVEESPNVQIHHNLFDRNYRALDRSAEDIATSISLVEASHNYFSVLDGNDSTTTETRARAVIYAFMLRDGLIANSFSPPDPTYVVRDTVTPGFQVLPYYEDKSFSRPVPPPLEGFIDDTSPQGGGTLRVSQPTLVRMSYPTGRTFNLFETEEGETFPTQGSSSASPPGYREVDVFLTPGTHDVMPEAFTGRGVYQLATTSAPPMPYRALVEEKFDAGSTAWTREGFASPNPAIGADGVSGLLRLGPSPGAAKAPFSSDLHELVISYYLRLSDGGRLLLQVDQSAPLSHPILQLRLSPGAVESPTGYDGPGLTANSWHKVELRFAPPTFDLYIDNEFVTSLPLIHSPVAPGVVADATIQIVQDAAGVVDVDNVLLYQGEVLPGALVAFDFEGGDDGVTLIGDPADTVVLDGRGSQTGAAQLAARPVASSMQTETSSGQSAQAMSPPIPSLVQQEAYGSFGGSPTYADGQSLHVSTAGLNEGLRAALPGSLRHYHVQQLVNLPQGIVYESFTVLGLRDSTGDSLFRLTLNGGSGWAASTGQETIKNVAHIKPARWHKIDLIVTEGRYDLLLDETPIAQGAMSVATPTEWEAGFGTGSMLVDNLRFGFDPALSTDVSASSSLSSSWTPTQTTPGSVRLANTVPATALPGRPLDLPMLADYSIHLVAPVAQSTKTYVTRQLPTDPRSEYEVNYAFYLPSNTTVAVYDGFHLFRAEDASGLICSLALYTNDDVFDLVTDAGVSSTGYKVARETWHTLTAHIERDGKIAFAIDATQLSPTCPASARRPSAMVVGDVSTDVNPLYPGWSGWGEIYLDDMRIHAFNNAPSVATVTPASGATIGGVSVWNGTAYDPDAHDAVAYVELTLRQASDILQGPWRAAGTTAWNTTQATWTWPKGVYALDAVASDGRIESPTTIRTFTIDNSPVGSIKSPTSGSTIGGITTIAGNATPRFPRFEDDTVDSVRWRVGTQNWTNITPEAAEWTFSWNTTSHPRGTYPVTVESTKWLDTSSWTSTYNVDNSPLLSISSPAAGASVGGIVPVSGSMSPRYPISGGEQVDTLEYRIDSGAWTPITPISSSWSVSWNTSGLSKGTHSFYVRSTKWLDTTITTRSFTVDNSPDVAVTAPAAGSLLGGDVTFTGTARDRYSTYVNDVVDSLQFRVDNGGWMTGNVTFGASGWANWSIRIDTHVLPKGPHKLTLVGSEDGHDRWLNHTFNVDNTPIIVAAAPEQGASMDDVMYLRVIVTDPYPTTEHPYPTSVVMEDATTYVDLMLEPDPDVPGRVMAWRNVRYLTPGPKTITFRAYDGMENAAVTVSATVETGENLTLASGVARFAALHGPEDHDTYKIEIPADTTELRLALHNFQANSGSKVYLRLGGQASPTTYDFATAGDGTDEDLVLTPLTGLRAGTAYLWVQGHALDPTPGTMDNSGDYRLRATITRLGGGGILG